MFTYPRPESPPSPPMWMGVVGGLAVLGAMVGLTFHDYRMADVGIVVCSVFNLLPFVWRYRERRQKAAMSPHVDLANQPTDTADGSK